MAKNNETQVVGGVVQPRFYQVYGDLIESKEVMEPLALGNGTGPICGFDWVDTTQADVTITSVFNMSGNTPPGLREIMCKAKRVFLSTKENIAGQVYNAYTTPDGLCHIAPDKLVFEGVQPEGGWPDLSNPKSIKAFVVLGYHTYKADSADNPPSMPDFVCRWLEFGSTVPGLDEILSYSYPDVLNWMNSNTGVNFDANTGCVIGLYLVGWHPSWDTDQYKNSLELKPIMAKMNYTLCLVPYEGKYPVKPYGLNPFDIMHLKDSVKSIMDQILGINSQISAVNTQIGAINTALGTHGTEISKLHEAVNNIHGPLKVVFYGTYDDNPFDRPVGPEDPYLVPDSIMVITKGPSNNGPSVIPETANIGIPGNAYFPSDKWKVGSTQWIIAMPYKYIWLSFSGIFHESGSVAFFNIDSTSFSGIGHSRLIRITLIYDNPDRSKRIWLVEQSEPK